MSSVNIMRNINDATYAEILQNASKLVLVLFTTDYSGISQLMLPIVETASRDYADTYDCYRARCEESREMVAKFGIRVVPTLAVFSGNRLTSVRINSMNDAQVRSFLTSSMAAT